MSDEEVQETTEAVEVEATVEGSNFDDLPDWAKKEIKDLRKENGNRRAQSNKDKEILEAAEKWREHLDAKKTEAERLADENRTLAETLKAERELRIRSDIARDFKLDKELVDLLTGDEDEMRAKAEILSTKLASSSAADFGGGQRGAPPNKKASGGKFLEGLANY